MTKQKDKTVSWTRAGLAPYRLAMAALAVSCAACRRLLAEHSIVFFAWYYLRVRLALHQEIWVRLLLYSPRYLLLAPRGHGKTEIVSKILPLWLICRDRNIRILMVTKAKPLARKNAMLIRTELKTNQRLIADFGAFYHQKESSVWQQAIFQVVRSRTLKDATFEAIGLFGSITGGRFDLIIFDDPIDPSLVTGPEQIQKVIQEVQGTYIPLLEPEGRAWVIGTRKHYSDLYGALLKNRAWRSCIDRGVLRMPSSWHIEVLKRAIITPAGFEQWYRVVIDGPDKGKVLWPERWSMERLLERRVEMGSVLWQREIQNEVVDEATALFPWHFLNQCKDEGMSYCQGRLLPAVRRRYSVVIAAGDPSLVTTKEQAQKTDSDYMVLTAIGVTPQGRRDLLAIERDRGLTPSQVLTRIEQFYNRITPFRMMLESNSFGILHITNLVEGTDMHIVPHRTSQNKSDPYEGVAHLSPLFENRKIRLPYKTDEDKVLTDSLLEELHAFGTMLHDDQVMALWINCFGILRWLAGQARIRKAKHRT